MEHVSIRFPNKEVFELNQPCASISTIYDHLIASYPFLSQGGFQLNLLEGDKHNTASFHLILGESYVEPQLLLGEMGEYILFEITMKTTCMKPWTVWIAIDPTDIDNDLRWYGVWDSDTKTVSNWYKSLSDALFFYDEKTAKKTMEQLCDALCLHRGYIRRYMYLWKKLHI